VTAVVFSIYMSNVSTEVVRMQRKVVEKFLPKGWDFVQYGTTNTHAEALNHIANKISTGELTIFLDIDCVPLTDGAFKFLEMNASAGMLTGLVQRANHKQNDAHLYIGPSCMAFSREKYQFLGSPSFNETVRADIGEELTYTWEEMGEPLCFLWPSQVSSPLWDLRNGERFGLGTTYDGMFYHSFCIRDPRMHQHFIQKCNLVLGEKDESTASCHAGSVK
jgi:hypothetical protein